MPKASRAVRNGLKALRTVEAVLNDVGWKPEHMDVEGALRVDFTADNTPIADAIAEIRIEYERFLYYLNFKDRVPNKYRLEAMEFVTRVNYDLVIGNFELNLENGLVRVKSSIDFTEAELTPTLVRNAIRCGMDVVEQYGDAIVEVMRGKKDSRHAIKDAEAGLE